MTRIMKLDESTRVNLLDYALRGFPTTRGPENLRTVCEIAALSSTDPVFIGTMLGMVPNPEECLAEWTLLTMRADHEVMMTVLADRFGLDWKTAKIPSRWFHENGSRDHGTFEQALIEHDAVRMFTTAVERGWCKVDDLHRPVPYFRNDWSRQNLFWLEHALARKAEKIADQLITYDAVANDPMHLAKALHHLSIARHEHDGEERDFVIGWWTRLLQAGADPWLTDEQSQFWGAPDADKATTEGATPGHRMLRHALNQLADQRFRGEGLRWMEALNTTLTWAEAPVIHGQSLAAFAFAHPKFGANEPWGGGSQDTVNLAQPLLEGMARQTSPLHTASPDWNPVELLLRPHLMSGPPRALPSWQTSVFDKDKPPVPSMFDQTMARLAPWNEALNDQALDGPAVERLAQRVVSRMPLTRQWADRPVRAITDDVRSEHNQEWLKWVGLVHERLQRLDRWVRPAARPAWQAWTREWHDNWSSWPDVPDDQVKAEGPRRQERVGLNAVFLTTAETTPAEPRLRSRL